MEIKKAEILFEQHTLSDGMKHDGARHVKSLPWLSIVQSVQGDYEITLDGKQTEHTGSGGFFIAPSQVVQDIVHHLDKTSGRMINRWIFLDVRINDCYRPEELFDFPTLIPEHRRAEMNALFDELFRSEELLLTYAVCYRILALLLRIGTPKASTGNQKIADTAFYLREHYSESFTVAGLARRAQMSESCFFSAFREQFGSSPIAYLNHYRLTVASELLSDRTLTISEISDRVGFSDPFYFSRLFRRTFGVSPREYRAAGKGLLQ